MCTYKYRSSRSPEKAPFFMDLMWLLLSSLKHTKINVRLNTVTCTDNDTALAFKTGSQSVGAGVVDGVHTRAIADRIKDV